MGGPAGVDGGLEEGVWTGDLDGPAGEGVHEGDGEAPGVVVEDFVGRGGVLGEAGEEGGELELVAAAKGGVVGWREVRGPIVGVLGVGEEIGQLGAGFRGDLREDLLDGGEGEGVGWHGCPGTGLGGSVLMRGLIVEGCVSVTFIGRR